MSRSLRTIVAGVATVHETDPVIAPAVALAEATGAQLAFVHAYELPDPILNAYARDGILGSEFGANYREKLTTQLEERVRAVSTSDRIACVALPGSAADVLCAEAERRGADLLLVGATRAGKLLRSILGSTAERVVRAAHAPVLVLRRPFQTPPRRVLLTTDLSDFSAYVHEQGMDLVEAMGGEATPEFRSLLVVWYDVAMPPPLRRDALEETARAELASFLATRKPRPAIPRTRVRIGEPAKEISAEAAEWDANLLILGTHSRSGRSRFLLGSVAEATVRTTTTNVLILPAEVKPEEEKGIYRAAVTAA
jgi:nucleotide-binding universal stress UspA family protein